MINSPLLYAKISESGLKISYIANSIGLSRSGFYKKLTNKAEFKNSEINKLSKLLGLSDEDRKSIFLSAL